MIIPQRQVYIIAPIAYLNQLFVCLCYGGAKLGAKIGMSRGFLLKQDKKSFLLIL